MGIDSKRVEEVVSEYAAKKGISVEEVRGAFEAILDKFCADEKQGTAALKFLGFDERPSVDEFIAALATNPELLKVMKRPFK